METVTESDDWIADEKLAPIVVVIDEFANLADQLETKKEQNMLKHRLM